MSKRPILCITIILLILIITFSFFYFLYYNKEHKTEESNLEKTFNKYKIIDVTKNDSESKNIYLDQNYIIKLTDINMINDLNLKPNINNPDVSLIPIGVFRKNRLDTIIYFAKKNNQELVSKQVDYFLKYAKSLFESRVTVRNINEGFSNIYKEIGNCIIMTYPETTQNTYYQEYHVYQRKSNDILNTFLLEKDFQVIGNNQIIRYQSEFAKGNNINNVDFESYYPIKQEHVSKIKYQLPMEYDWEIKQGNSCYVNTNFNMADDIVKWSLTSKNRSKYNILNDINWSQFVNIESNKRNLITVIKDNSKVFYKNFDNDDLQGLESLQVDIDITSSVH